MTKYICSTILCALFLIPAFAQTIDRTKPPKAGPAPVIKIEDPKTFTLPNGIVVLVVENHRAPKVQVSYSIDRPPVLEGKKAGVISFLGGMLSEGTLTRTKAKFDEEVDLIGATLNVGASGGSASSLTKYFDKAVELLSDALRNPSFPAASLEKIRQQALQGLKADEKNPAAISSRVVRALNFGTSHPYGEFETEESYKSITLDDIKTTYRKYVTPSGGYLAFVGDITPAKAKQIANTYFGSWKGAKITLAPPSTPGPADTTQIDVVDVPNAVQAVIKVTHPIDYRKKSPDYFPMIVANEILGGGADSRLFKNLREKRGFTYGAYSSASNDRFGSGTFTASASVRNAVADSAIQEFMNELKAISTEKVSSEELRNVKNSLSGEFALSLENPATVAQFALNIAIEKLPKDFYRTYLQKVNAVTAEDVQKAAQKYILLGNTRIVVTGKNSDFGPSLNRLGYPVRHFDAFAKPVEASAMGTKKADPSVTPEAVIKKYMEAIGGESTAKTINAVNMDFEASVQGNTLQGNLKKMNPAKEVMAIQFNGTTVMKSVFDGEKGYQEMQGQKKDMDAEAVNSKKAEAGIFRQLNYSQPGYKLSVDGVEKLNGEDAYKMTVTAGSGKKMTEYYDVKSGLLVKVETTEKTEMGEVPTTVEYRDYKKFGNVMFPTVWATQMGPQTIDFNIKAVKINEAVAEGDFK